MRNKKLLLIISLFTMSHAQAEQTSLPIEYINGSWNGVINPVKDRLYPGVPELVWTTPKFKVRNQGAMNFTVIEGSIPSTIREIDLDGKPIPISDEGTFKLSLGFPGDQKTILITAYDTKNVRYMGKYTIQLSK